MKKYFIFYILVLFVQVTFSQPREERYPNGKLKLLEKYKNGMQHGLSSYYYDNGIKSKEGNFENGKEIELEPGEYEMHIHLCQQK